MRWKRVIVLSVVVSGVSFGVVAAGAPSAKPVATEASAKLVNAKLAQPGAYAGGPVGLIAEFSNPRSSAVTVNGRFGPQIFYTHEIPAGASNTKALSDPTGVPVCAGPKSYPLQGAGAGFETDIHTFIVTPTCTFVAKEDKPWNQYSPDKNEAMAANALSYTSASASGTWSCGSTVEVKAIVANRTATPVANAVLRIVDFNAASAPISLAPGATKEVALAFTYQGIDGKRPLVIDAPGFSGKVVNVGYQVGALRSCAISGAFKP
ncbi:MAG: hypothetical protein U0270_05320 [Labilithrix sp.]